MGISSIDDLLPVARDLVAAGDLEFFGRPEWASLQEAYGIDFDEKLTFDTSLMYTAVAEGQVDIIAAYTTDGRVAEFDLLLLEDPLNALPPYDGFLAASGEAMDDPLFVATLSALENKISNEVMREANRLVDVEGRSVSDAVAYIRDTISSQ
jgi:osmoprotectant transport system permease protein